MNILLLLYAIAVLGSMATMSIGAGLVLIGGLILAILPQERGRLVQEWRSLWVSVWFRRMVYLTLGYALVAIISLLGAWIFPVQIADTAVSVKLKDFQKLWFFFFLPVLILLFKRMGEEGLLRVLKFWLRTAMVLAVFGIVQFFTGVVNPQIIPWAPEYFHVTLLMGHHLSVASAYIFPFFIGIDALSRKAFRDRIGMSSWEWALLIVVGGWALFLTFSRALWLALPVGLLVILLPRLSRRHLIGFFVGAVALVIGLLQHPLFQERIRNPMGISTRMDLWQANLHFFSLRPIFGVGFGKGQSLSGPYLMEKLQSNDVFSGHAHSMVIEVLASTGLVGLIVWLAWWFCYLGGRNNPIRKIDFRWGIRAAWIALFVNGLTQVNFWEGKVFHSICFATAWWVAWVFTTKSTTPESLEPSRLSSNG